MRLRKMLRLKAAALAGRARACLLDGAGLPGLGRPGLLAKQPRRELRSWMSVVPYGHQKA